MRNTVVKTDLCLLLENKVLPSIFVEDNVLKLRYDKLHPFLFVPIEVISNWKVTLEY